MNKKLDAVKTKQNFKDDSFSANSFFHNEVIQKAINIVQCKIHEKGRKKKSQKQIFQTEKIINPRNYDDLLQMANFIKELASLTEKPKIGIICGSGLGDLVNQIQKSKTISFSQIPGFPKANVLGHKGNLVFGYIKNKFVICVQGRFHPYEHNMDLALCGIPVRLMHFLGVKFLLVSNAAGGINLNFECGDLMIIRDQIFLPGLAGFSPLVGLNDARFGARFISLYNMYDKDIRDLANVVAKEMKIDIKTGVYAMCGGPQYESLAEINFLKTIGADAVGMSTCYEVSIARQCNMRVFGFSLITNVCNSDTKTISHEEVLETGKIASNKAQKFLTGIIDKIEIDCEK